MKRLIALAVIGLTVSVPAHASYVSGNYLYEQCNSEDVADQNYCLGFIIGVTDRGEIYQTYAIPTGVEAGQVKDVVMNLLREHPEKRQSGDEP